MANAASSSDARQGLGIEFFDGTDATLYKTWKRKAQVKLLGLPTTIPKHKFAVKVLESLAGEAADLFENYDLDELHKDDAEKIIWKVLDAEYLPKEQNEMPKAMDEFFDQLRITRRAVHSVHDKV